MSKDRGGIFIWSTEVVPPATTAEIRESGETHAKDQKNEAWYTRMGRQTRGRKEIDLLLI